MSLEFAPGTILGGDFRLGGRLGQGGMGEVLYAEQISTGRARALKVMHPKLVDNAQARERFVLEARVASQIESDHVVEVVAAGVDLETGVPWMAMELLEGETLSSLLERVECLTPTEVLYVFRQIGHALAAAHKLGIVHRDLKPQNIFLQAPRREGSPFTVKVLDFGIAKVVSEAPSETTEAVGTPLWMSPEQTDRRAGVSPSSDVWALGLLVFRALIGRSYWHAEGQSIGKLLREILVEPLPEASVRAAEWNLAARVPAGMDGWFANTIARAPNERFQSAGAATSALSSLLGPYAGHPLRAEIYPRVPEVPRSVNALKPATPVGKFELSGTGSSVIHSGALPSATGGHAISQTGPQRSPAFIPAPGALIATPSRSASIRPLVGIALLALMAAGVGGLALGLRSIKNARSLPVASSASSFGTAASVLAGSQAGASTLPPGFTVVGDAAGAITILGDGGGLGLVGDGGPTQFFGTTVMPVRSGKKYIPMFSTKAASDERGPMQGAYTWSQSVSNCRSGAYGMCSSEQWEALCKAAPNAGNRTSVTASLDGTGRLELRGGTAGCTARSSGEAAGSIICCTPATEFEGDYTFFLRHYGMLVGLQIAVFSNNMMTVGHYFSDKVDLLGEKGLTRDQVAVALSKMTAEGAWFQFSSCMQIDATSARCKRFVEQKGRSATWLSRVEWHPVGRTISSITDERLIVQGPVRTGP